MKIVCTTQWQPFRANTTAQTFYDGDKGEEGDKGDKGAKDDKGDEEITIW